MACINVRYDLKCCARIVLDRCPVHAQDETLSCTCPDPNAGFAVVVVDQCRSCQHQSLESQQTELISKLTKRQARLLTLEQTFVDKRMKIAARSMPIHRRAKVMCTLALHIAKVEERLRFVDDLMERKETDFELKKGAIDKETADVGSMDIIGAIIEDEWVMWCTGEQDDALWKKGWGGR